MHYAITNDENRVKKTFAYDISTYTLLLDHHMNTERMAWKWEDNPMGEIDKLQTAPHYYDYIISVESDKPVNIFEKHVIAAATDMENTEGTDYYILTGYYVPSIPVNEMMGTGYITNFYTDMMVSAYAGASQIGGTVHSNLLSYNTDETFGASMFAHYDSSCFTLGAPFGAELDSFFADMNPAILFSLVNRFAGDFYSSRFYGAGMSLFLSTHEEDSNVRIKIYRKQVAAMTAIEEREG